MFRNFDERKKKEGKRYFLKKGEIDYSNRVVQLS